MNLPPPGFQPTAFGIRPAPPLPPSPPSKHDDPDWIWTVNVIGSVVLMVAAIGVLVAFAIGVADLDDPDSRGWGAFFVILGAVLLIPILAVLGTAAWLGGRRNRAAFVLNVIIGLLAFRALFPLLVAAAGIVGLVLTTNRRREQRRAALRQH